MMMMPEGTDALVADLVREAREQGDQLAQLAGRPACWRSRGALAAARLRYMALRHRWIADRLMAEAGRIEGERDPAMRAA